MRNKQRPGVAPLDNSIWHARLQTAWLAYAGIYSGISQYLAEAPLIERAPVVSVLNIVGAWLVFGVVAHTLHVQDRDKATRTLLVAFGAVIYLVTTSLRLVDYAASVIASIWALLLGVLLWLSPTDAAGPGNHRFQYYVYAVLCLSSTGLSVAFTYTLLLHYWPAAKFHSCIGPSSSGAFCGLFAGLFFARRSLVAASGGTDDKWSPSPALFVLALLSFCLLCSAVAALLAADAITRRWTVPIQDARSLGAAIGFSSSLCLLGPIAAILSYDRICSTRPLARRVLTHGVLAGAAGGLVNGAFIAALRTHSSSPPFSIWATIAIEMTTGTILSAAILLGAWLALRLRPVVLNQPRLSCDFMD